MHIKHLRNNQIILNDKFSQDPEALPFCAEPLVSSDRCSYWLMQWCFQMTDNKFVEQFSPALFCLWLNYSGKIFIPVISPSNSRSSLLNWKCCVPLQKIIHYIIFSFFWKVSRPFVKLSMPYSTYAGSIISSICLFFLYILSNCWVGESHIPIPVCSKPPLHNSFFRLSILTRIRRSK